MKNVNFVDNKFNETTTATIENSRVVENIEVAESCLALHTHTHR